MRPTNHLLFLFCIGLLIAGCTKDPGPIPANMSRIKVECRGLSLSQYISVTVAETDQIAKPEGSAQKLGCFFYDEVYFTVSVPPYSYNVISSTGITVTDPTTFIENVTFSGTGEQKVIQLKEYIIGGSVSI